MRYVWRLGKIPDGATPLPGQPAALRRVSDGATLVAGLVSDPAGFLTYQSDGHLEPFYLHLSDVAGGDKFWASTESKQAGALAPLDLPPILRALGDGVVRGYSGELAVS